MESSYTKLIHYMYFTFYQLSVLYFAEQLLDHDVDRENLDVSRTV